MIKRLRRKFIIVNMAIVTVMLAVIFGLILFFTKSNMEQDNIQMLRSVSMMPIQCDMPDNPPQKMIPSVFAVYKTSGDTYEAWGSEVVDFSDSGLLSEIYNTAVNKEMKQVFSGNTICDFISITIRNIKRYFSPIYQEKSKPSDSLPAPVDLLLY